MSAGAYHGPYVLLTPREAAFVGEQLAPLAAADADARAVVAKCAAAASADPKLRTPTA